MIDNYIRPRQYARRLHGLTGTDLATALLDVPQEFRQIVEFYVSTYAHDLDVRRVNARKARERMTWHERISELQTRNRRWR